MSVKVSDSTSSDRGGRGRASSVASHAHAGRVHGASGTEPGTVERAGASSTFLDVVDDVESRQLIDEIDEIAAQMTKFPTATLVRRYRELVGMALDKVRSGMQIRREFKWRRTERAMFITIEKTEGLLDDLEGVLMREGDRARSLALVDEIKGCLISMLF